MSSPSLLTGLAVRCSQLRHVYHVDGADVVALEHLDLTVYPGESLAVFGPSGSGKSTLMMLLAGLRRPTAGRLYIGGDDITRMTERDLLRLRGQRIGVVVQQPSRNLLPYATAIENIRFAQSGAGRFRRRALPEPVDLLRRLRLEAFAHASVGGLSGGEQQRLSVALAMSNGPGLLLADEPTSQLDSASRDAVVGLLRHITEEFGTTVVAVTHDPEVAAALGRSVGIAEGLADVSGQHVAQHVVIGAGGAVTLPPDVADRLPPGTRARIVRKAAGIELVREQDSGTEI